MGEQLEVGKTTQRNTDKSAGMEARKRRKPKSFERNPQGSL